MPASENPVLDHLVGRAAVALEGELHVLGGDGLAIVKPRPFAEDELVDETVLGDGPRLGQARRRRLAGHGFHHGVVQRIEHHEGRDHPDGVGGIEPERGQRDVHAPDELAFGSGEPPGGRNGEDEHKNSENQDERASIGHEHASF